MKTLRTRDEARTGGRLGGPPDRILKAERANPAAGVSSKEREIDDRVHRHCGLTPEEIKIVEDASSTGAAR
jgi:hypothetical protein